MDLLVGLFEGDAEVQARAREFGLEDSVVLVDAHGALVDDVDAAGHEKAVDDQATDGDPNYLVHVHKI